MSREAHVRFCEGLGVKFPRPTRLDKSRRWESYLVSTQYFMVSAN